jgi:tRNA dimethylallyltransferase
MFEMGLGDEVQGLVKRYGADLPLLSTLGYAETLRWQQGELSQEEAIALIQQNTRRYAKRQLAWFRREPDAVWLEAERYATPDSLKAAAHAILEERLAVST